jgi:putative FmdB family regulatory protein
MPIYEYRCSQCGKTFEKIQKFVDPPVEVHEECGGPVERLISTSALQFKGSGFYITDYKGASKSGESKSEHSGHSEHGGGESKSDSKGEGKSESKSEGKSESKSESKAESKSESRSGESHGSKSSGSGDSKSSESQSSKSSKPAPATKTD